MSEQHVYPVPPEVAAAAHCDNEKYLEMYKRSVEDPEGFWDAQGRRIDWIKPYSRVKDVSFAPGDIRIRWFDDGTLNVAANVAASRAQVGSEAATLMGMFKTSSVTCITKGDF